MHLLAIASDVFISFILFLGLASLLAGVLTMPDFMAYIEIMRRLLGNEFVCAADIVAIPKESDRFWINEHIRAHRPGEFISEYDFMSSQSGCGCPLEMGWASPVLYSVAYRT